MQKAKITIIRNSNNSLTQLIFFIALCCNLQIAHAQIKYDVHTDSLVKSFLIENNILLEPVHEIKYLKGKKVIETNNYYLNIKKIKVSDTSSVSLTVFGAYNSHPRDYLLIDYYTPGYKEYMFVGQRIFEEDIVILKSFFDRRQELTLVTKRAILEAFSKLN